MKIVIKEINFEKEMTFSQMLSSKGVEHYVEIKTYNHSTQCGMAAAKQRKLK